jgi:hemolysin-activating ACP:hemolysin acyltransferase
MLHREKGTLVMLNREIGALVMLCRETVVFAKCHLHEEIGIIVPSHPHERFQYWSDT